MGDQHIGEIGEIGEIGDVGGCEVQSVSARRGTIWAESAAKNSRQWRIVSNTWERSGATGISRVPQR